MMKPTFKSPPWAWGILLLAILFIFWRELNWLVVVSCLMAIFLGIVLQRYQRNLTRRQFAEKTLRNSEERFRHIAENAPDLIYRYRFTPTPGFEYVSPSATSFTGYTPEEHYADPNLGFKLVHPDDRGLLESLKNSPAANVTDVTLRWIHKDGTTIWTEQRIMLIRDAAGNVAALEGIARNITERRRAEEALRESQTRKAAILESTEEALRESEERYRTLVEHMPDGMYRSTPAGRYVDVNPALVKILGYDSKEELLNVDIKTQIYFDPSERESAIAAAKQPESDGVVVVRHRRKDGQEVWLEDHGRFIIDDEGNVIYHEGILRDITARRRAEEARRQSEERYRTLVERLSDGVYRSTPEGKFIEVNPAMVKMLGYASKEELMALDIKKQLYFKEQERTVIVDKLQRAGGDEIDVFRLRRKDGHEVWVEDHGQLIYDAAGKVIYHEGILRDISLRKHAEEALRESEERYRSVIGALAEGVILYDADGSVIASNDSAERILGITLEQIRGRTSHDSLWRAIHEDGTPFPNEAHPSTVSLRTGQLCSNVIMGVHKPSGELAWISINSQPLLRPGEQKPYAVVASFYDITERKWAEEALRESEERYRLLAENTLDLISLLDLDGNILYASPSHYYVIGYTPNELVHQNLFGVVHADDIPHALSAINSLLAASTRKTIELRLRKKNGDWIEMEALLTGIPGPGNAIHRILFSARDITVRKQAEEHIKASLKEKEVLLKEIHHRVKNNLQIISSLLNLQSDYIQDQQAGEMFKESRNRVKSMALIHEKLYLSKDLARIDFAEYVRNLTTHLFRSYGVSSHTVGLKIDVDKILLDIDTAIPCGLIVNELVTNSLKYAFPPGVAGEIRIELHKENNGQLALVVSDNGAGLPPAFDLHQTDSLGLQLVSTLTDQLEGKIALDRDGGTTFKILLHPHNGFDSRGATDGVQNSGLDLPF